MMTIGRITGTAILAVSLCGLLLVGGFAVTMLRLEHNQSQLTENSTTLGDLVRLQDALKQWILLGDLVYGSGETYLIPGSQAQSKLVRGIVEQLRTSPIAATAQSQLLELAESIKSNDDRLEQASTSEPGSHGGINPFVPEWDARTERAVQLFEQVDQSVRTQAGRATLAYQGARRIVFVAGSLLSLAYLALVMLLWHWQRRKLTVPLQHITDAAETALRTGEPLHVVDEGPVEVVRMARSANRLAHLLEERVAQRTEELSREVRVRRRAEELAAEARDRAEAGSRAKSEFIANMSHELRTPLNGVLGMAELLSTTELTDRQKNFTHVIRLSAGSLMSVINDVLDYSRTEAGKLELELAEFDVEGLCADSVQQIAGAAGKKDLEIICSLPDICPTRLIGDDARLRQVLLNLLGNAVKFTDHGTILLRLECQATDSGNYRLSFAVEDSGIGIARKHQDVIFESFQQVESGTTRRFGGTGLGLTICRRLIHLMGGEIGVHSALGEGSRFWFTVELPSAPGHQSIAPREPWLLGRRALLVEPNDVGREILKGKLRALGMTVATVPNATEGLAQLVAVPDAAPGFDLLVITRPAASDAASNQAAQDMLTIASSRQMPVVWLNRLGDGQTGDGYSLTKPVTPYPLRALLHRLFPEHRGALKWAPATTSDSRLAANDEPLNLRILLVEDDNVNQLMAESMLEILGCHVVSVDNGRAAIDAATCHEFDVILMDCQMPDLDGLETTARIRMTERKLGRTPTRIVAVTANAMMGDREMCLIASMDDYLAKPYSLEQLRAVLRANSFPARRTVIAAGNSEPQPRAAGH